MPAPISIAYVFQAKLIESFFFSYIYVRRALLKALQKAVIAWANRFGERDVNNSIGRVIPKVHWASI